MIYYANWKLNKTSKEVGEFFDVFNNFTTKDKVCFFVSSTLLDVAKGYSKYYIGAQNVCYEKFCAETGELSIAQALRLGAMSVLVGHSERRIKFAETDEVINKKLQLCASKIECVLCVGETLSEIAQKQEVVARQLKTALVGINPEFYRNIIIAYEPVWAIGSGNTPTSKEIEETVVFIKNFLFDNYNCNFKVIYGGSVNASNVGEFKKIVNLDGFLIGGASLDARGFQVLITA